MANRHDVIPPGWESRRSARACQVVP